jgi:hypothetical protein
VRRFVKRVEPQPPPGLFDRLLQAPRGHEEIDEACEHPGEVLAQGFGLHLLPVLEVRGVAQHEAAHEIRPGQRRGLRQQRLARVAALEGAVGVGCSFGEASLEPVDVAPDAIALEGQHAAVGGDPPVPQRSPQRRQRPAEGGARPFLVVVRPQEAREPVAPLGAPLDCEVCQHGDGLARVDLDHPAVDLCPGRAEQLDLQHVTLSGSFREANIVAQP